MLCNIEGIVFTGPCEGRDQTENGKILCKPVALSPGTKHVVLSWNLARYPKRTPLDVIVQFFGKKGPLGKPQRRFGYCKGQWCSSQDVARGRLDADKIRVPRGAVSLQVSFRTTLKAKDVLDVAITTCWSAEKQAGLVSYREIRHRSWGVTLPVRSICQLSANDHPNKYREIDLATGPGLWICAPTSVAMVLGYMLTKPPHLDEVANACYDPVSPISYGVWGIDAAVMSSYLPSPWRVYVARFTTLLQLENEIANGRVVVASISWKEGELDGALRKKSAGHMVVVIGFTQDGDVIVNDPLGSTPITYDREQFWNACHGKGKDGIVYIVHPC